MLRRVKDPIIRAGLLFGLLSGGLLTVILIPSDRAAAARPPAPLPLELQYVPADAAVFLHADAAQLWDGSIGKAIRAADQKFFEELAAQANSMFGATPDAVKSVTLFWPKLKRPQDGESFGVVVAFNAPFDKQKLKAGIERLSPVRGRSSFHTPTDRVAVWLAGLDEEYAKPRPAEKTGPLTGAIREAASGKHLLVAASALANLPDEIRGDNLPDQIRAFQPLLRAESLTGIVDLDDDLSVQVRVKTSTPAGAVEAEKALGALTSLLREGLAQGTKELGKDAEKEPGLKDVFAILKAVEGGLKGAKYETDGTETRATVKVPAALPFGSAVKAAVVKVRGAAARSQSTNNLKQIVLAMHNYASANNDTFPPAAVVDKKAKPLLSWRVLILPYIEQDALYKQFKLDEPWDSEHNKKLLDKMPKTYAVPGETGAKANETHYRVFVGNGAAFDKITGPRIPADFPDGTSNTMLVATAAEAVPWTKPDELTFDPDKDMKKLLGFFPGDVCPVGLADGSVRALSKRISKETLNAAITRNGGEVLGEDF
ncbi:MAG: hypothetical protein JWO38_7855 [Gemmataceae bacterium]|nr:hypothetical protein [Gemmataceae bacterium]